MYYYVITIFALLHICMVLNTVYASYICYDICLTALGLTLGGSSTVHIYTQITHNNAMTQNTQNETYITIRILKRSLLMSYIYSYMELLVKPEI
jgi:hypothetical protein